MKRLVYFLMVLFLLAVAGAEAQKTRPVKKRPARKAAQDKRVYLVHADVLHFDQFKNPDATILNGKVHFTHVGARLYCDSAYFYEASNSFEAFGHVRMYQGDTLSLVSDYAYYDGNEQMARARYNVVLKNRKTTLYTDSLDFDRLYDNAYFFEGGSPKFYLTTDTLYYDNARSIAHIVGPSHITSGNSTIYSEQGYYDTKKDQATLMNRSVLRNQGKSMVGDSVYYDSQLGFSQAFRNVIYVDSVNKNKMTGNYGEYWENTGYALCTDSAVAIDYSQGDSLYMHADTLKVVTFNIETDSVYRKIHAYHHVRAYRTDVQAVCDSLIYNSLDSCMTMYFDPIVWNYNQQLMGDQIDVFMKDSLINRAHVIGNAFSIQQLKSDTTLFNQVSSKEMFAYFIDGKIHETQAKDNVLIGYFFEEGDSVAIIYNYQETTEMRMFLKDRKLERVWTPKTSGTMYPPNQIPAEKKRLEGFAWYDYVRPMNRYDIFVWRPKKKG